MALLRWTHFSHLYHITPTAPTRRPNRRGRDCWFTDAHRGYVGADEPVARAARAAAVAEATAAKDKRYEQRPRQQPKRAAQPKPKRDFFRVRAGARRGVGKKRRAEA